MGDSPKWVKSKKLRKRRRRGLNDGDNNGQATHGAHKHSWRMQAAWAKTWLIALVIHTSINDNNSLLGGWGEHQEP